MGANQREGSPAWINPVSNPGGAVKAWKITQLTFSKGAEEVICRET
jgi:hypothetical protein